MALNLPANLNRRHTLFLVAAFSASPMSAMSATDTSKAKAARSISSPENIGRMVATNVQEPTSELYKSEEAPWPLVASPLVLEQLGVMCGLILPKASAETADRSAAMPAFVAEWISGQSETQKQDRALILQGLEWMDAEIERRHKMTLITAGIGHLLDVMNDISHPVATTPQLKLAGQFFSRLRALVIGGFYTPGALITRAQPELDGPVSPYSQASISGASTSGPQDAPYLEPHEVEFQSLKTAFKSLNIESVFA